MCYYVPIMRFRETNIYSSIMHKEECLSRLYILLVGCIHLFFSFLSLSYYVYAY